MVDRLLHVLGFGLCHQLPERSFTVGGIQAPVCARDTGIYVGVIISLSVIALLHRGTRPREFPRAFLWFVFAALVGFMGWDGITSYAGLRDSNNALRLVTGLCTGFAVGAVLVPMLNDEVWAQSHNMRVLDGWWRVAAWLIALPVAAAVLWWAGPLMGAVYPILIGLAILATLTAVNLVLIGMLPAFDRKAARWQQLVVPSLLALALGIAEIVLSGLVRWWMLGLV